jgi:DNA-binding transcriptional regulator YbjK
MLRDCWRALLSLAEQWACAKQKQLTDAAAHLYVLLFVEFDSSVSRQEVLQALHGHLGSGVKGEEDVALQVRPGYQQCALPLPFR